MAKKPKDNAQKPKAPEAPTPPAAPDLSSFQLPEDFDIPKHFDHNEELRIKALIEYSHWSFIPPEAVRKNIEDIARFLVQEPELFKEQARGLNSPVKVMTDIHGMTSIHPEPEDSQVTTNIAAIIRSQVMGLESLSNRSFRISVRLRCEKLYRQMTEDPILLSKVQDFMRGSYLNIKIDDAYAAHFGRESIADELGLKLEDSHDRAIFDLLSTGHVLFSSPGNLEYYTPVVNLQEVLKNSADRRSTYSRPTIDDCPITRTVGEDALAGANAVFYTAYLASECVPWRLSSEISQNNIQPRNVVRKGDAAVFKRNPITAEHLRDYTDSLIGFLDSGRGFGKLINSQIRFIGYRIQQRVDDMTGILTELRRLESVGVDLDSIVYYVPKWLEKSEEERKARDKFL